MKPLLMLLFSVSLSGTLPFIIYLIAGAVFRDKLSATIRYRFLKLCLLFYLVPFSMIKYVLSRYIGIPTMNIKSSVFDRYIYMKDVVQQTDDRFVILLDFPEKLILGIIAFLFYLLYFLLHHCLLEISFQNFTFFCTRRFLYHIISRFKRFFSH